MERENTLGDSPYILVPPSPAPGPSYFAQAPAIPYEGPESDNPLAFRWYDAGRLIGGKTMEAHLRFSCAYGQSFCGKGPDPFGEAIHALPRDRGRDPIARAKQKADAAFDLMAKLGLPFYCFHDSDLVELTDDIRVNENRLQAIAGYLEKKQEATGIQLLWGAANLFSHRRYTNGAATNPDFLATAHAGAQVKAALDITIALGGASYVFRGGREGYTSLLGTDMPRERDHLATFLHTAKDYARKNGFRGQFFLEPKACEPMKHPYDYDAAAVLGFLRQYDLLDDFSLNINVNHATLAGHSFPHELQVAADAGRLGSVEASRADYRSGRNTDQFLNNIHELTEAMLIILERGGFTSGGIHFGAKIRRNPADPEDLFHAHIGGMDRFARALIAAAAVLKQPAYLRLRKERYQSFDRGHGQAFEQGKLDLEALRAYALVQGEPRAKSEKQEYYENMVYRFI